MTAHRENAELRFLTVVGWYIDKPTRWHREQLNLAADAVADEHYRDMERLASRVPGAFKSAPAADDAPGGIFHAYEPDRRPAGLQGALEEVAPPRIPPQTDARGERSVNPAEQQGDMA